MKKSFVLSVVLSIFLTSFGQEKNSDSLIHLLDDYNAQGNFDAMVEASSELISIGSRKLKAIGYYWRGHALSQKAEYERALRSYYTALDEYKYLEDTIHVANIYGDIAIIYYEVHDLKRAESFALKSIKQYEKIYDKKYNSAIGRNYLNIANFYLTAYSNSRNIEDANRAENYFVQAERLYNQLDSHQEKTDGLTVIQANLTMLYALMTDDRFMDAFDRSLLTARSNNDSSQIAMLYSAKSQYYFNLTDYNTALEYSDSTLLNFPKNGQPVFLIDFYKSRAEILKQLGDSEGALHSLTLVDSIERAILNSETIGDLQAISNAHEQEELIKASKERIGDIEENFFGRMNVFLLVILSISIVLLIIVILYLRNNRRKKRLQDQLIEVEQKEADTRDKLDRVRGAVRKQQSGRSTYIQQLQEVTEEIEKHERLATFADRSKTVSPAFIVSLKEKCSELSNRDIRLCILLLIGLSSKEISILSNIEPASVDRQRYRLRKKLRLTNQEKLVFFLEKIEHGLSEANN